MYVLRFLGDRRIVIYRKTQNVDNRVKSVIHIRSVFRTPTVITTDETVGCNMLRLMHPKRLDAVFIYRGYYTFILHYYYTFKSEVKRTIISCDYLFIYYMYTGCPCRSNTKTDKRMLNKLKLKIVKTTLKTNKQK